MAYLQESHPEVFFVLPRPGGIAKIDLPEDTIRIGGKSSKTTVRSSKSSRSAGRKSLFDVNNFSGLTGYVSREQRIKRVLQTSPWIFFEAYQDVTKAPSPMQGTIDILAITITSIMLMAADYKEISKNHLRWTFSYLSCIKDENGHTPPNVRGIMNHIKMMDANIDSFIEGDTVSSVEEVEESSVEPDVGKVPDVTTNVPAEESHEEEPQVVEEAAAEEEAPAAAEEEAPAAEVPETGEE